MGVFYFSIFYVRYGLHIVDVSAELPMLYKQPPVKLVRVLQPAMYPNCGDTTILLSNGASGSLNMRYWALVDKMVSSSTKTPATPRIPPPY